MEDLSVQIGDLRLKNPVMPASGTFSDELEQVFDLEMLGAHVLKTVTPQPRQGNPPPRLWETPAGMLNSIGIPNDGIDAFLAQTLPHYARYKTPLVVSISAETAAKFAALCRRISVPGVSAIEANISCPNLEEDGRAFAMRPESTLAVVTRLRETTSLPLWVKLSPNTGDIAAVAQAAETAGADALVVANTILGMAIDVEHFRPALGAVMGGLSGPATMPINLRLVYQCRKAVALPIIGAGGISSADDAVAYLLAGASAVQVGTATFVHPRAMLSIIAGLRAFMQRKGIARVTELVGRAVR